MTSGNSHGRRRRHGQAGAAMLVAVAALVGGQVLVPARATATLDSGPRPCPGGSWFDQVLCTVSAEDGVGGEVIRVNGTAPGPRCDEPGTICVFIGVSRQGAPDPDRKPRGEGSGRGRPPSTDEIDRGHPSCTKPSTGREAGVCPGKLKPGDARTKERDPARYCREVAEHRRRFEISRKEAPLGRINGQPMPADLDPQRWIETVEAVIRFDEADERKSKCRRYRI